MGHAGASRESPTDAPWETLSLRLSRPIFAPLLTAVLSWRQEEDNWVGSVTQVVVLIFVLEMAFVYLLDKLRLFKWNKSKFIRRSVKSRRGSVGKKFYSKEIHVNWSCQPGIQDHPYTRMLTNKLGHKPAERSGLIDWVLSSATLVILYTCTHILGMWFGFSSTSKTTHRLIAMPYPFNIIIILSECGTLSHCGLAN